MFFEFVTPMMRRPGLTSRVNLVEIALKQTVSDESGYYLRDGSRSNFTSLD